MAVVVRVMVMLVVVRVMVMLVVIVCAMMLVMMIVLVLVILMAMMVLLGREGVRIAGKVSDCAHDVRVEEKGGGGGEGREKVWREGERVDEEDVCRGCIVLLRGGH